MSNETSTSQTTRVDLDRGMLTLISLLEQKAPGVFGIQGGRARLNYVQGSTQDEPADSYHPPRRHIVFTAGLENPFGGPKIEIEGELVFKIGVLNGRVQSPFWARISPRGETQAGYRYDQEELAKMNL